MSTYLLCPINWAQINANGVPISGGKIYTYLAGSSTPGDTFTDNTGGTKQQNPITLNTRGLPDSPIWMLAGQALKIIIKDASGITISGGADGITGVGDTSTGPSFSQLAAPTGAGVVGQIAAAAAAIATTVQERLRREIDLLDFMTSAEKTDVLSGTGSMDVTAAVQACIDYTETIAWVVAEGGRPAIILPSGVMKTAEVVFSKKMTLVCRGLLYWVQKAGSTASHLTVGIQDIAGTSLDDLASPVIYGNVVFIGNRTDATPGTAHAINCTDTAWTAATQYSPAILIGGGVRIYGYTGDGIYLGANRNNAILHGVVQRYCNRNGMSTYGYDHQIYGGTFGENVSAGVKGQAGGMNCFYGTAIFGNDTNVDLSSFVNGPFQFIGGSNDLAQRNGFYSNSPAEHVLAVRFSKNSASAANTYSDIYLNSTGGVRDDSNHVLDTQAVKYLIENPGGAKVRMNASFLTSGSVPYGTAITSDFSKLVYAGTGNDWIGSVGAGTLVGYVGSAAGWKLDSSFNHFYKPPIVESANPQSWFYDTDAGANVGKWVWNVNGTACQFNASNDAQDTFTNAFAVNRSGAAITNVTYGVPVGLSSYAKASLPTTAGASGQMIYVTDDTGGATPAFCDGANWRRTADRNVIS